MDAYLASLLSGVAGLGAPALATVGAIAFIWAIVTERLVLGKQYRAERARGDKYEEAHRTATEALIQNIANQEATISIVSAFRKELAELSGKGGST